LVVEEEVETLISQMGEMIILMNKVEVEVVVVVVISIILRV
tara:strand:+ start:521 stop:643 length:123 start_codon:yes stop_codon:yes gene_type:complete